MKHFRHAVRLQIVCALLASVHVVRAQQGVDPERFGQIQERLAQMTQVLDNLPEAQKHMLSSGAQNAIALAEGWRKSEGTFKNAREKEPGARTMLRTAAAPRVQGAEQQAAEALDPDLAAFRVSSSAADFLFSIMGGFTQSETSTAVCGSSSVIAFNDSGSLFESVLFGPGGVSFSGAAVSSSPNLPFRDVGFVNPGANTFNFLLGDPVVTCNVSPGNGGAAGFATFYYSQLLETGSAAQPITAVALSRSTSGGATWEDPIAAIQKDGVTHFIDKPWSATDPTNPNNIFVTYTDFDHSGSVCGLSSGAPISRTAIELVRSTDGGATWTPPLVIIENCATPPNFSSVQGSQVAVDSAGNIYVAWESFAGATGTARALAIRKSTDHAATFAPAVRIDSVTETGDGGGLQGLLRNNEFPMLAIDRTSGALYVVWNDGRNFALPDVEAADGLYHYADILISRSTNGGATWSPALRVNSDPLIHFYRGQSRGTDHYMPGVAVDNTGAVGVCWYDRRLDPANSLSNRFCSVSRDGGITWPQTISLLLNSQPWHATDALINPYYLGDYDSVASDFTLTNAGFLGGFGFVNSSGLVPNQDVGSLSFP